MGPNLRPGFTLVELVVVIAIVGLLIALLLPAVMASREAARETECKNHLKQLATAMLLHHEAHGHFPTDGWGYQWVGDPDQGFGQRQPGGWVFNILPYLEQESLRNLTGGMAGAQKSSAMARVLQTPLPVFQCPGRRAVGLYKYTEVNYPLRNSDVPATAAKTDYAACAGHQKIDAYPGPASLLPAVANAYQWPDFSAMTGICFIRSTVRIADVVDGMSNTLMIGEKYVSLQEYGGESLGDDQTMYIGDDADIRRWTCGPPLPDRASIPDIQRFGSAHASGCCSAFCDGSVRVAPYSIDAEVYRRVGNRHDGQTVDLRVFP